MTFIQDALCYPLQNYPPICTNIQEYCTDRLRELGYSVGDWELESYTHITVLYGIHVDTPMEKLSKMVKNLPSYYTVGELGIFEKEEQDIIRFNIRSSDLKILNGAIRSSVNNTQSFPNYHPHCTVMCVPRGTGRVLVEECSKKILTDWGNHWITTTYGVEYTYSTDIQGVRIVL